MAAAQTDDVVKATEELMERADQFEAGVNVEEKEKAEQDRLDKEKAEQDRIEKEQEEKERKENEEMLEAVSMPDAGEDSPFRLEISYVYTRYRNEFGRPIRLAGMSPKFLVQMPPNEEMRDIHLRLEPAPISTQYEIPISGHDVDAHTTPYTRRTQKHVEGGYPIEVNTADIDMVVRYQRKQGRTEELFKALPTLISRMERALNQNNSSDIYEEYFVPPSFEEEPPCRPMKVRTVHVFKDPMTPTRPVVDTSWEPGSEVRLASAHSVLQFQRVDHTKDTFSYVWNLSNPNRPEVVLDAGIQVSCLDFNPREKRVIVGGLCSGQMCFWDIRKGSRPIGISSIYESFRDVPTCVLWINSKTNSECFSSSSDGQVLWWDVRNIKEPIDKLLLDLTKADVPLFPQATGVTKLGYEYTMPNKFMVGTEDGNLVMVNRKGKTLNEKIGTIFKSQHTPIRSCKRNPGYLKIFMTAGDWTVRIWSEDCKESSIFSTQYETAQIAGVTWAPNRGSVFYVAKKDASIDVWDLLYKTDGPLFTHKVGTATLTCLENNEEGTHLSLGDERGCVTIAETSDHFNRMDKAERAHINAYFDREGHREKLIEAKVRETRLKQKSGFTEVTTDTKKRIPALEKKAPTYSEFKDAIDKYEATLQTRLTGIVDLQKDPSAAKSLASGP